MLIRRFRRRRQRWSCFRSSAAGFMEGLSRALGPGVKVFYHRGISTWGDLANATNFFTSEAKAVPGLTVERFDNPDLAGSPAEKRTESHINLNPPERTKTSSARWTGYYFPKRTGQFELFVQAPGERAGHRVFVDGRLVIDDWKQRRALLDQAALSLTAAPHKVVFEQYAEGPQGFFARPSQLGIFADEQVVDAAAKKLAAEADAVVVAAGFDPESESEGADRTFVLPAGQDQLIREMVAANKNTIVVVTSGGAVETKGWLDTVPALIEAWYPGQSGGICRGRRSPWKRQSVRPPPDFYDRSWEDNPAHESYYPESGGSDVVYRDGIFVGYRGYDRSGKKPLFPFGFGLSYTKFEYSQLTLKATGRDDRDPRYEVSFNVKNTGGRPGAEVAQVYVSQKRASVPRPPKELKAFARLDLQPSQTRLALLSLDARSFAYYDVAAKQWRSDPGEFEILIGASAEDIRLRGTVSLSKPVVIASTAPHSRSDERADLRNPSERWREVELLADQILESEGIVLGYAALGLNGKRKGRGNPASDFGVAPGVRFRIRSKRTGRPRAGIWITAICVHSMPLFLEYSLPIRQIKEQIAN